MRRPWIGITMTTPKAGQTREDVIDANRRYVQMVEEAGGAVEVIIAPEPANDPAAVALVHRLDGLILSGGGDIHPRYYYRPGTLEYDAALAGWFYQDEPRDEVEIRLLRHYLPTGKPILAICRGFQVLNVALGGKLIADLAAHEHNTRPEGISGFHEVTVLPASRLGRVLGCGATLRVNSRHHQGITLPLLAPGLRPAARSDLGEPDGEPVIEGYEASDDRWLLAVQWHPERLPDFDERGQAVSRALFRAFVDATKQRGT